MTISNHLATFLCQRPAISFSGFARELGLDQSTLHKIVNGKRQLPAHLHRRCAKLMRHYGYPVVL